MSPLSLKKPLVFLKSQKISKVTEKVNENFPGPSYVVYII